MRCHLICGSLLPFGKNRLYLELSRRLLKGLSCWCKTIVTVLLMTGAEMILCRRFLDFAPLSMILVQSHHLRVTID